MDKKQDFFDEYDFTLLDIFSEIQDPRINRQKKHELIDIIVIAICAIICGGDGWEEIEYFGKARKEWFSTILSLPNGIPSHDTFARVFSLIDPDEFKKSYQKFIKWLQEKLEYKLVSIDGKALRGTFHCKDKKSSVHMVSAFVSENSVVLGQVKVAEKSNEIKAIPELLKLLFLEGTVVTIDAMGCQKEIAAKIIDANADYVLALKGNQGTLLEDVSMFFNELDQNHMNDYSVQTLKTEEDAHGRHEEREYFITSDIDWLENKEKWAGLTSIGKVISTRTVKDKKSTEIRYYIASIEANEHLFAQAVRGHWGIENSLHWVLDTGFREDSIRIHKGYSAENLAVMRHLALALLKNDKILKKGVVAKRKAAAWDNQYLEKMLLAQNIF